MRTCLDVVAVTLAVFVIGQKLSVSNAEAFVLSFCGCWMYLRCVKEK